MAERNPAGEPEETADDRPAGDQPADGRLADDRPADDRPADDRPASDRPDDAARPPLDEEAAWLQIVAGYGEQPDALPDEPPAGDAPADTPEAARSITVFSAGSGPRDWDVAKPSDDDFDASDEGHFVPPEPPPLPQADTTAKFAWLAVLGGPLLLIVLVVIQEPITWWSGLLGIGGFLGGFATLVARMRPGGEDDDELPGGGAVV